jgi:hypothetical protein
LTIAPALDTEALKALAVHLMRALKPVVGVLVSDSCTPQDRQDIRKAMGEHGVFDLKNDLIGLCGERARNSLMESQNGDNDRS